MATIASTNALSVGDGNVTSLNVDTVNKLVQVKNGASIVLYADDGVTQGLTLNATGSAPVVSTTAPAIANAGTITTAGVGVARITPTAARTGIILQAGTVNGQSCWIVNEASNVTFSITFDVSGTSHVSDGVSNTIYGNQARHFLYDTSTSLWYSGDPLVNGGIAPAVASATAPAIANAGTIATSGVGVSRVAPAAAVTGVILQAGTISGQICNIVNESVAANTITFAVAGTSNVADGVNNIIDGVQGKVYIWDGATSLWYGNTDTVSGALNSIQSATAPAIANAGTITTAGVGVARVAPAGAVTGIIIQAGTLQGQELWVINEAAAANTLTLNTTPATANVADSATEAVIPGLKARHYVWDISTLLWYPAL